MKENKPDEKETEVSEENVQKSFFSLYFDWVEMFVLYISIGLLLLLLIFRHSPVEGHSMNPTLHDNDILLVSKLFYKPETGDIIVCQSENYGLKTPLVKRVIATGGQTVSIDYENWKVTVDGTALNEDYINFETGMKMKRSDYLEDTFTVPEGYVFVMGDNRNHSNDSRFEDVGMIDERYILGEVKVKLLPLKDFKIYGK